MNDTFFDVTEEERADVMAAVRARLWRTSKPEDIEGTFADFFRPTLAGFRLRVRQYAECRLEELLQQGARNVELRRN